MIRAGKLYWSERVVVRVALQPQELGDMFQEQEEERARGQIAERDSSGDCNIRAARVRRYIMELKDGTGMGSGRHSQSISLAILLTLAVHKSFCSRSSHPFHFSLFLLVQIPIISRTQTSDPTWYSSLLDTLQLSVARLAPPS